MSVTSLLHARVHKSIAQLGTTTIPIKRIERGRQTLPRFQEVFSRIADSPKMFIQRYLREFLFADAKGRKEAIQHAFIVKFALDFTHGFECLAEIAGNQLGRRGGLCL